MTLNHDKPKQISIFILIVKTNQQHKIVYHKLLTETPLF